MHSLHAHSHKHIEWQQHLIPGFGFPSKRLLFRVCLFGKLYLNDLSDAQMALMFSLLKHRIWDFSNWLPSVISNSKLCERWLDVCRTQTKLCEELYLFKDSTNRHDKLNKLISLIIQLGLSEMKHFNRAFDCSWLLKSDNWLFSDDHHRSHARAFAMRYVWLHSIIPLECIVVEHKSIGINWYHYAFRKSSQTQFLFYVIRHH